MLVKKIWNRISHPSPQQPFPLIIMYGNEKINIEHIDELLYVSEEMIATYCQSSTVEVIGNHLSILLMKQNELIIQGKINEVNFYPDERRK